ncbi:MULTISPECIES: hypothetical protein [unclassified Sulfitobacter]|nr:MULTISPECIES: hypothetical protein [unclassified Sulfitobacter]KZY26831.1 hypothetical protein A3728_14775 [Sulfitobacter sp. HI0040]KZZ62442.1 hypothetical protein A3764_06290 [Sulfitobacter sp. HI0129]
MAEPTERIAILIDLEKDRLEKNARSAAAAIDRLERKFNPLAAAEERTRRKQDQLNAALEAGTISAKRHATGMDLLQREYDQTAAKITGTQSKVVAMNSAVAAQTGFLTRNRSVFQQAGYQVGDFAVQVQGGTSALTAFTQQGSQLLGVFGPFGAILGAALAVGAPLAGYFLATGEAAASLEDQLKALKESIQAVQEANSLSGVDMVAEFGAMASEAKKVFEINQQIAAIRARSALDNAARGIAGELGVAGVFGFTPEEIRELDQTIGAVQSRIQEIQNAGASNLSDSQLAATNSELERLQQNSDKLNEVKDNISDLEEALGITEDEARGVVEKFAAIGQARGPEEQARAISELTEHIHGASNGLSEASDEGKALYDQLLEATIQALNLAKIDVASNIGAGANEAARLAENLGISLEIAGRLANARAAAARANAVNNNGLDAEDPRNPNNTRATVWDQGYDTTPWSGRPQPKVSTSGGRSGSGGRKSSRAGSGRGGGRQQEPLFSIAENELQKLRQQIDMLGKSKSEVAALTVKHRLLEEAKRRGLDITEDLTQKIDAEAANVGKLAEQYDLARDKIAAMEKVQSEWKDSIIDAAMGGANAMDQFTNSIKRAALEYLLFGEGMFAGGSKSQGGFGGLLGGIFAGMFDGGGRIPSGKFGIAGENGPEIIRGPAMVTSTKDTAKAMGGGGQMDVRVYVDQDGNWQAKVEQISGGVVQRAAPGIAAQSVNRAQASFRNSKSGWTP